MCFDISLTKEIDYLEERFDADFLEPDGYEPIYHVSAFGMPSLPVIPGDDPAHIHMLEWGLVPHWIKGPDEAREIRTKTMNARGESVLEKPSFRDPARRGRCLVLADGFFEWREVRGKRYPYYIRLKGEEAFALAGISDRWRDPTSGKEARTFSVLTTEANPLLERIHNTKKRMPVILPGDLEGKWIGEGLGDDEIRSMLTPFDQSLMEAHTVSRIVSYRDWDSNVPEAIKRHYYPELGSGRNWF